MKVNVNLNTLIIYIKERGIYSSNSFALDSYFDYTRVGDIFTFEYNKQFNSRVLVVDWAEVESIAFYREVISADEFEKLLVSAWAISVTNKKYITEDFPAGTQLETRFANVRIPQGEYRIDLVASEVAGVKINVLGY